MAEPHTYAELKACLLAWFDDSANRIDPAECIGLAERRLSRLLSVPEMEKTVELDLSINCVDLPADFREVRECTLLTKPAVKLEPTSLSVLRLLFPSNRAGEPTVYAVSGQSVIVAPAPDRPYVGSLTYKSAIPALSDGSPTNWLLTKHPDLYVAASLAMAEFRGWNDARLPMIKAWYDELIEEVNEAARMMRAAA